MCSAANNANLLVQRARQRAVVSTLQSCGAIHNRGVQRVKAGVALRRWRTQPSCAAVQARVSGGNLVEPLLSNWRPRAAEG